ncbi:MAG: sodium:solute symporter family protein [Luteolibacter sp.]
MQLHTIDLVIIIVSIAVCFLPAIYFARRASKNLTEFFASGQSAPWWLIGVSMVATTFSTDTPNLVTDIVRNDGIAGNWCWWAFLLTGMMTVFLYARMWRRSGVITDLEYYEIRYGGKASSAVRGFRAIYLGLLFNCFMMASVNLAAVKIAAVAFGWPAEKTLIICGLINVIFAATSGLWGVLVIDLIQFGIAMIGAFALAFFALGQPEVGGLSGLSDKVSSLTSSKGTSGLLNFVPDFSLQEAWLGIFLIPLLIQWWSVWYPGSEPGGGSYIAQRMLAAKSERDALLGTLFFNAAHYALRPWPWIIVALATFLIYPIDPPEKMQAAKIAIEQAGGADKVDEATRIAAKGLTSLRQAYPDMAENKIGHDLAYPAMLKFLPKGFLGIMLAGLLAAYVSTIITHLNWGTSYLVHDFYRRFIKKDADQKHYIAAGRVVTGMLMIAAGLLTLNLESAKQNFDIILSIGAGTGLLYLLRWFWWRITAWSEIAAMISSFVVAIFLLPMIDLPSHIELILSVAITTFIWLMVTWLTPPADESRLINFYKLVRPGGPGWSRIRAKTGIAPAGDSIAQEILGWALGCIVVWTALFSTGSFLFGRNSQGFVLLAVFLVSSAWLVKLVKGLWVGTEKTNEATRHSTGH